MDGTWDVDGHELGDAVVCARCGALVDWEDCTSCGDDEPVPDCERCHGEGAYRVCDT